MSEFFKTSTIWVVDFLYEGRPRRWLKAFGPDEPVQQRMVTALRDLHGGRARLVSVRRATDDEELQFLRGNEPRNVFCPTGRHE